jgi:hypothetical protein
MMKTRAFTIFILMLLVLSACGPEITLQSDASQVWIDAPLPGSHLPLAEVEIVAHSANPGGVASFEIDINGQLLTKISPDPASIAQTLMYARYFWLPAAPGSYMIEVTAFDLNNQPGTPAQVVVEVGEAVPSITPTDTETQTSTPIPSPTCGPLTFTPNINAYCRQGPGEVFPALEDLAMKGQPYLMDGRNSEGSWYRIMLTPAEGCWVPVNSGTPSCDPGDLRVLLDIPTPVNACALITDKTICNAQSICKWQFALAGPGMCVNK